MFKKINAIKIRSRLARYLSSEKTYLTNFRVARPVKNITTGEIFRSMHAAANMYGVDATSIKRAINHPNRTCAHCQWVSMNSNLDE